MTGVAWCCIVLHMQPTPGTGEAVRKALTAAELTDLVGYKAPTIYRLVRDGRFPAPIDADRPTRSWRWSPRIVEDYIDGVWTEVAA